MLLNLVFGVALLTAQAGSSSAPLPILIELESRDGSLKQAQLSELDASVLGPGGAAWLRMRVRPEAIASARSEGEMELRLRSGDRLRGEVAGGSAEVLKLELMPGLILDVSIDDMDRIIFSSRLPTGTMETLAPAAEGDRLYRRIGDNLDRIDGAMVAFGAEGVTFEGPVGRRAYLWKEIAAIFIEPLGESEDVAPASGRVLLDLTDGSRLRGVLKSLGAEGARVQLGSSGQELLLPPGSILGISVDDGSVAFLSDRTPDVVEEGSLFGDDFGMTWPHRVDRSVSGGILSAGGMRFAHGLGVHAPSKLTWKLDGTWNQLRGFAAIDDEVLVLAMRGSVIFRVYLDGERAYESSVVVGGKAPIRLPELNLTGVKELTLEVDPSENLFVADRADWLRMVLIR